MTKLKKREGIIFETEHKKLILEKQELHKLESNGKISEDKFKKTLEDIDARINCNVQRYIEGLKERANNIVKIERPKEENTMAKETKKEEKPKRVTNTDIILELLQRKGLKTVEDTVAKFKEKNPNANEKNVKQQVKEIIAWVKKGHKKYAAYTWNQEAFLLTPKE